MTIAVVLIIGLVVGGTWAFFSDIETTPDEGYNTYQAGVIDLVLEQPGTVVVDGEFTDLKPCQTGYLVIILSNPDGEHNNPMYVWKHITIDPLTDRDENGVTGPEEAYYLANSIQFPPGKNDIDCYIHFDMWIANVDDPADLDLSDPSSTIGTLIIDEADGWLLSDNTDTAELDQFLGPVIYPPDDNGISCWWIYLGRLEPGETMIIVQSFHLDGFVDNWAQSDTLFFTEEFFALQTVGNVTKGALPGPEFPGYPSPLPLGP